MSFFVPLDPLPGEPLLGGYLVRLCEQNLLPKMGWLLDLLAEHTGVRVKSSLDLIQSPELLDNLERLIPTRAGALSSRRWISSESVLGKNYRVDGQETYDAMLMTRHAQICPQCLAENGHVHEEWLLAHLPICRTHGVALVDTCPTCHRSISNDRTSLSCCQYCGTSFQEAAPHPVSDAAQDMARSMVKHQGLLLGHTVHQEELNLNECARLFLLIGATLNTYAKPLYTPARCDAFALIQRLAAFEFMAAAWSGDHLDSRRIREVLLKRWPYLGRISETLLAQRMDAFMVGRHLHMFISNMIMGDDPEQAVRMAAYQPNETMPYIQSEADATDYLGISAREFHDYQIATGCLNKTEGDWCYDADELVAARKLLNETLSDSGLDEFLGVDGSSKTLQNMGLLKPWSDYSPDERKYAPWDIQALYDKMWTRVIHAEAATPLVSLGNLVHQLEMDEPGAALMSRVLNQDLPIRDWQPPYRFSDIWVEKAAVFHVFHEPVMRNVVGSGQDPLELMDGMPAGILE